MNGSGGSTLRERHSRYTLSLSKDSSSPSQVGGVVRLGSERFTRHVRGCW